MAQGPRDPPADGLRAEAVGRYLGSLFDAHASSVHGLCRALLRDSFDAEDAVQQTFLSAYGSLLNGHAPRDPAVWLATIARHECLARLRARKGEQLSPIAETDGAGEDVEQIAGRQEDIGFLREALSELPEAQREAILLREFHGLSYEEVGAASGLSQSAVKSVLFRARKRLKARLGPPRGAAGVALLPIAFRDSLTPLVPGFGSTELAAAPAAKAVAVPLGAKLVGATVSIAVVGALGGAGAGPPAFDRPSAMPTTTGSAAALRPGPSGREASVATRSATAAVAASEAPTRSRSRTAPEKRARQADDERREAPAAEIEVETDGVELEDADEADGADEAEEASAGVGGQGENEPEGD